MAELQSARSVALSDGAGMLPLPRSRRLLRLAGLIGIFAAAGNLIADLFLEYNPQGYDATIAPPDIALWRVFAGYFLGMFVIPLEIIGYWLVCTLMLKQAPRLFRALFWLMAYVIIIGTVFHSLSIAPILIERAASTATSSAQSSLSSLQALLNLAIVPLAAIFFIGYLAMWGIFFVFVLRKRSPFPRWLAFFSPALVSLLITVLYESHVFPLVGNLLYPAVLSFPHLVFYGLITALLWKRTGSGLRGQKFEFGGNDLLHRVNLSPECS